MSMPNVGHVAPMSEREYQSAFNIFKMLLKGYLSRFRYRMRAVSGQDSWPAELQSSFLRSGSRTRREASDRLFLRSAQQSIASSEPARLKCAIDIMSIVALVEVHRPSKLLVLTTAASQDQGTEIDY